jgi:hypothetical protein
MKFHYRILVMDNLKKNHVKVLQTPKNKKIYNFYLQIFYA